MATAVSFRLNGRPTTVTVDPARALLWVLRTELALTGVKYGCGASLCGACTVLVDRQTVRSCVYPVGEADGKDVLTIEGLARNGELHPVQQAFVEHDALQCGFCTPGMILGAYSLLLRNPDPSDEEIVEAMEGHLCRCGGYGRVLDAVRSAAERMRGAGS